MSFQAGKQKALWLFQIHWLVTKVLKWNGILTWIDCKCVETDDGGKWGDDGTQDPGTTALPEPAKALAVFSSAVPAAAAAIGLVSQHWPHTCWSCGTRVHSPVDATTCITSADRPVTSSHRCRSEVARGFLLPCIQGAACEQIELKPSGWMSLGVFNVGASGHKKKNEKARVGWLATNSIYNAYQRWLF